MQLLLPITVLAAFAQFLAQASQVATLDVRSCTIPDNEAHQITLPYRFTLQALPVYDIEWTDSPRRLNNRTFHVADDLRGLRLSSTTQTFFELRQGYLITGRAECQLRKTAHDEEERSWNDGIGANVVCGANDEFKNPVDHFDLGWTARAECLNDTRTFILIPTFEGKDGKSEKWNSFMGFDRNQPSFRYGGAEKNGKPSE
jgi:hypothetical protein